MPVAPAGAAVEADRVASENAAGMAAVVAHGRTYRVVCRQSKVLDQPATLRHEEAILSASTWIVLGLCGAAAASGAAVLTIRRKENKYWAAVHLRQIREADEAMVAAEQRFDQRKGEREVELRDPEKRAAYVAKLVAAKQRFERAKVR